MRSARYGVSVFLASLVAGPALAQQADEPAAGPTETGEIIVTAQKRSEKLRDVPLAVVSQTGAQLAAAGIVNTRDLPQVVPGLTFSATGAWSQPAIRGVSSTTTNPGAESPVAIYLDGIYQPSQNGQIFDLPDISRIEVLKGPQGTLFGRNATAGAIQIFTRDPTFEPTLDVTGTLGRFGGGGSKAAWHYGAKGFASMPLVDDMLAISLSGYIDRNDGYLRNLATGKRDGEVTSKVLRGKLLFTPASNVKFVLTGMYSRRSDYMTESGTVATGYSAGAAVPGAIVPTRPFAIAYDEPRPTYQAKTWAVSLRGDVDFSAGTLTTLTGYNDLKAYQDVDVDATFVSYDQAARIAACPGCIAFRVITPTRSFSQEIDFISKQFGIFSVTSGLNYFWAKSEEGGIANRGAFFYSDVVRTRAYAAFAELNADLTDRLTAIGGIRYNNETKTGFLGFFGAPRDRYKQERYKSWTPRASVRYALTPALNAFFTYSKGFKSGVLQNTDPVAPSAAPEKLESFEGGVKYGRGGNTLNLSYFHYNYSNLQALIYFGATSITQNAAAAKIDGFDFDSTLRVTPDIGLRAAASWIPHAKFTSYPSAVAFVPIAPGGGALVTQPVDASGTRLLRAPKVTLSGGIDYARDLPAGKLTGSLIVYHSSAYRWEVTNRVRTDPYTTLNLSAGFAPTGQPFRFGAFAKNLTAEKYVQGTLLSGSGDVSFYAPPREIGLTLGFSL